MWSSSKKAPSADLALGSVPHALKPLDSYSRLAGGFLENRKRTEWSGCSPKEAAKSRACFLIVPLR